MIQNTNEKQYLTSDNIISKMEKLRYKHGIDEIFNDCMEIIALSIIGDFTPMQALKLKAVDTLKGIWKKYSKEDNEIVKDILEDIGAYVAQYGDKPNDYLGEIYMKVVNKGTQKHNQQFFTPFHMSEFMGMITSTDIEKDNNELIKVNDCCCGSGSLSLGKIEALKKTGIDPLKRVLIFAEDIDIHCVYMAFIQLCIAGAPAVVEHKDTLLNKTFKTLYTPWYFTLRTHREKLELEDK